MRQIYEHPPKTLRELLVQWHRKWRAAQYLRYEVGKKVQSRQLFLGTAAAFLAAGVGTAAFATIGETAGRAGTIIVGVISFLAAGLAALQTGQRHAERADRHRVAGGRYGKLIRHVEQVLASGNEISENDVTELREQCDSVAEEAPHLPKRLHDKVADQIDRETSDAGEDA